MARKTKAVKPAKPIDLIAEVSRLAKLAKLDETRETATEHLAALADEYADELCARLQANGYERGPTLSRAERIDAVIDAGERLRGEGSTDKRAAMILRWLQSSKDHAAMNRPRNVDAAAASVVADRAWLVNRDLLRSVLVLPDATCIDGRRVRALLATLPDTATIRVERVNPDCPWYVMRVAWQTSRSRGSIRFTGQPFAPGSAGDATAEDITALAESQCCAPMAVAA